MVDDTVPGARCPLDLPLFNIERQISLCALVLLIISLRTSEPSDKTHKV